MFSTAKLRQCCSKSRYIFDFFTFFVKKVDVILDSLTKLDAFFMVPNVKTLLSLLPISKSRLNMKRSFLGKVVLITALMSTVVVVDIFVN